VSRSRSRRPAPEATALADDAELLGATARGDIAALEALYGRHGAAVHALGRLLGDEESAAAATVEVFVSLWRYPARFDCGGVPLRALLLSHADAVRHRQVRAAPAAEATPLAATEREAVTLTVCGGHTYRQVAALLGLSERTVLRLVTTALSKTCAAMAPEPRGM
jgi:DNA-directed RNA polymerase specialized sigma24 family protein